MKVGFGVAGGEVAAGGGEARNFDRNVTKFAPYKNLK